MALVHKLSIALLSSLAVMMPAAGRADCAPCWRKICGPDDMTVIVAELVSANSEEYEFQVLRTEGPFPEADAFALPRTAHGGLAIGDVVVAGGTEGWSAGVLQFGPLLVHEGSAYCPGRMPLEDLISVATHPQCMQYGKQVFRTYCSEGCQAGTDGAGDNPLSALGFILGSLAAVRLGRKTRSACRP